MTPKLRDPIYNLKKLRCTSNPSYDRFKRGLRFDVASDQHNFAVVKTARRKLHTKLNNICTVLTLTGIESQHSIWCQRFHCTNEVRIYAIKHPQKSQNPAISYYAHVK